MSSLGPLGHPEVTMWGGGQAPDRPCHVFYAARHFNKRVMNLFGRTTVDKYSCIMKLEICHLAEPRERWCRSIMIAAEVAAKELGALPRMLRIVRPVSDCMYEANR